MALTLGPAVSRPTDRVVSRVTYGIGMFAGAIMAYAVIALAETALAQINKAAVVLAVVLFVASAILRDLGVGTPVPYTNLQVAEWLRDLLPLWGVGLAFGWLLGLGFVTKFTYSAHTALLLTMPLVLSVQAAVAVLAVWVSGRVIVTFVGNAHDDPSDLCRHFQTMRSRLFALRWSSALGSTLTIGLLLVATIRIH